MCSRNMVNQRMQDFGNSRQPLNTKRKKSPDASKGSRARLRKRTI